MGWPLSPSVAIKLYGNNVILLKIPQRLSIKTTHEEEEARSAVEDTSSDEFMMYKYKVRAQLCDI